MNIGKKLSERLTVVRLWIALNGSPEYPESAGDPEIAEQPLRADCPACTGAPGFRVLCGNAVNTCPMAVRNPDGQPGSPPVAPETEALEPGQEPGFTLPWAAGIVPWAVALAKLALQAATWWRQAK
jgi:hypothetical protein